MPMIITSAYDALVGDGKDNVLVAITGENGDGIAVIDLSSLPEPLVPSYPTAEDLRLNPVDPEAVLKPAVRASSTSSQDGKAPLSNANSGRFQVHRTLRNTILRRTIY